MLNISVSNIHLNPSLLSCVLFVLFKVTSLSAQEQKDTSNIYHKLEKGANKYRATRWIYDAVFENPANVENTTPQKFLKTKALLLSRKTVNPFLKYKGKIIRNISVIGLDPFGYSVNNLYARMASGAEMVGNAYHISTKEWTIRNFLLFKKNSEFDPLEISESERLLRLAPYINDAHIYVEIPRNTKNDSVDIMVVVQDRWSTFIGSKLNTKQPDITLTEKNIFGLGHQFVETFSINPTTQFLNHSGSYTVFNFRNTFITSKVVYSYEKENKLMGLDLSRPFYSPLAKWAGGVSMFKNFSVFTQPLLNTIDVNTYSLNFNTFDFWGAKSFPLFAKKSATIKQRSSNFIIGARYYHLEYFERPSFDIDQYKINQDQTMHLANIGFSLRTYYRDRYLYRFGANEDIPEGFTIEIVQGTLKKELLPFMYYSGLKIAAGKHFDNIGYLSGSFGYGTFYNNYTTNFGVANFDALYFSDLIQSGHWFFRQFTRLKIVEGIHRAVYETININGNQLYGFSSPTVSGTSKIILNLDFVIYAPLKVVGFNFAPVVSVGFGNVGSSNLGSLFNNNVFSVFALGLLIKNEYLISNTFELSIGLYPYMPGSSDYSFKINPITSYNLSAHDYSISKPELVSFQ